MRRRELSEKLVLRVTRDPVEVIRPRPGREIRQSFVVDRATGKSYLVRIVVDVSFEIEVIVTAYKTSRMARYRGES